MFRVGLHLCGLVIMLALEGSVCDDQIVFRAKTQKKFTFSVALANSTQANHTWPFVHLSNPDFEVTACYQFRYKELSAELLSDCSTIPP